MPALDPKNIAESYAAITNQIQLKNLQLKVGNMKRKVEQVWKIHEGRYLVWLYELAYVETIAAALKRDQSFSKGTWVLYYLEWPLR